MFTKQITYIIIITLVIAVVFLAGKTYLWFGSGDDGVENSASSIFQPQETATQCHTPKCTFRLNTVQF